MRERAGSRKMTTTPAHGEPDGGRQEPDTGATMKSGALFRRMAILLVAAGALVAALLWYLFAGGPCCSSPADCIEVLRAASRIDIEMYNPRTRVFTLTDDPAKIDVLLDEVIQRRAPQCCCDFAEHMVFHTDRGPIRVFASDHLFLVSVSEKTSYRFQVTPRFWGAYQALWTQALNRADPGRCAEWGQERRGQLGDDLMRAGEAAHEDEAGK